MTAIVCLAGPTHTHSQSTTQKMCALYLRVLYPKDTEPNTETVRTLRRQQRSERHTHTQNDHAPYNLFLFCSLELPTEDHAGVAQGKTNFRQKNKNREKVLQVVSCCVHCSLQTDRERKDIPPHGVEPWFRDSKSHVLTTTLRGKMLEILAS